LAVTNWISSVIAILGIYVYWATSPLQDVIISHRTNHYIEEHEGEHKERALIEQKERRIEREYNRDEAGMTFIFS